MAILLSLAVYAALCGAIARIYGRTGHSFIWKLLSFSPLALVLLSYAAAMFGIVPEFVGGALMLVVLVYLALLLALAFKAWPQVGGENVRQ
jgi:hypothetical protein